MATEIALATDRMRLLIDPDTEDAREAPASAEAIRAALSPPELWYGAEFELRPDDPDAPRLSAVSVWNAYAAPEDAGDFMLGLEERGGFYSAEGRFTRAEVVAYFERFVSADLGWIPSLAWREVRGGQPTGRYRDRAI